MKLAPSYVSKSRLLKKIEQRTAERAERIQISENINTMDKAILEDQKDTLARYAERHNCSMRFVPDKEKGNDTVMKVYADKHVLYRPYNPINDLGSDRMVFPIVEHQYRGQADIPSSHILTTDRMFTNKIKASVKNILDSNKGLDTKV